MGIPSVTTNLSGFGSFIEKQIPDHDNYGLYIVDRQNKRPDESIAQLSEIIYSFWSVQIYLLPKLSLHFATTLWSFFEK